jgi:hypothetical protein
MGADRRHKPVRKKALLAASLATGLVLAAKAGGAPPDRPVEPIDYLDVFVGMPLTLGVLPRLSGNPYLNRAVIYGGYNGSASLTDGLERNMSTLGNATLISGMSGTAQSDGRASGNDSRMVVGENSAIYWAQASLGASTTFGNLSNGRGAVGHTHNQTRIIYAGGLLNTTNQTTVDYRTIATVGTAVSFGALSSQRRTIDGRISNGTRGLTAGGWTNSSSATNRIDYWTFATTGNATQFGSLTLSRERPVGGSSNTRGVFGSNNATTHDYVTIATTGNATSFGTITAQLWRMSCSNGTRVLWTPSMTSPSTAMLYVNIATTGNAQSFGSVPAARYYANPATGFFGV